jgi:hypothetical protein
MRGGAVWGGSRRDTSMTWWHRLGAKLRGVMREQISIPAVITSVVAALGALGAFVAGIFAFGSWYGTIDLTMREVGARLGAIERLVTDARDRVGRHERETAELEGRVGRLEQLIERAERRGGPPR